MLTFFLKINVIETNVYIYSGWIVVIYLPRIPVSPTPTPFWTTLFSLKSSLHWHYKPYLTPYLIEKYMALFEITSHRENIKEFTHAKNSIQNSHESTKTYSIINELVTYLFRGKQKDSSRCASFSLHWRPIGGLRLLPALWFGCCLFDIFPISILNFITYIKWHQSKPNFTLKTLYSILHIVNAYAHSRHHWEDIKIGSCIIWSV